MDKRLIWLVMAILLIWFVNAKSVSMNINGQNVVFDSELPMSVDENDIIVEADKGLYTCTGFPNANNECLIQGSFTITNNRKNTINIDTEQLFTSSVTNIKYYNANQGETKFDKKNPSESNTKKTEKLMLQSGDSETYNFEFWTKADGKFDIAVNVYQLGNNNLLATTILDPLFQVDYTPEPAQWLIDGNYLTDDDGDFSNIYNVTANMSDNNTNSFITIDGESSAIAVEFTSSEGISTTSSTTYQEKVTLNFNVAEHGDYLIAVSTAPEANGATGRGMEMAFFLDGEQGAKINHEHKDNLDKVDATGFFVIPLDSGSHSVGIYFKSLDGNSVSLSNVRITIERLDGIYHYASVDTEQTITSTSGVEMNNLTFNVNSTQEYFVMQQVTYSSDEDSRWMSCDWQINGVTYSESYDYPNDDSRTRDYPDSFALALVNLTAGQNEMTQDCKVESNTGYAKDFGLIAIPFGAYPRGYAEDNTLSSTTSTNFQTKVSLDYLPPIPSINYVIGASMDLNNSKKDRQVYWELQKNGSTICDGNFEAMRDNIDGERNAVGCIKEVVLTNTTYNFEIVYKSGDGDEVSIDNARILLFPAIIAGQSEQSASAKFSETYNASYDWFLRLYKNNADPHSVSILSYIDSDSVNNTINVSDTLSGTGYFNIPVNNIMQYETNNLSLGYSAFRIGAEQEIEISQIELRKVANDSTPPQNNGCYMPDLSVGCLESLEFICDNITDNLDVDYVEIEIFALNQSFVFNMTKLGDNYSLVCPLCALEPEGIFNPIWMNVTSYDISGNSNESVINITTSYDCNYSDFINISHNSIIDNDIFLFSNQALIQWTTTNNADSLVKYGLSPLNLNLTSYNPTPTKTHSVLLSPLTDNATYYYNVNSSTNPTQEVGTFNFSTSDVCVESWVDNGVCLINDSQIANYTDTNACGTFNNLPVDNGTYTSCNYCSEDLQQVLSSCSELGLRNVSYTDNNYFSCCVLTNITADCSILSSPYNQTTQESCITINNTMDCDTNTFAEFGYFDDKIYWVCEPNLQSGNCMSYVMDSLSGVVQVNPQKDTKASSLISLESDTEERSSFEIENGLVNVYFTNENMVFDGRSYGFKVKCSDGNDTYEYTKLYNVEYESVKAPITRWLWIKDNLVGLVLGFVLISFLVGIIGMIYYQLRWRT